MFDVGTITRRVLIYQQLINCPAPGRVARPDLVYQRLINYPARNARAGIRACGSFGMCGPPRGLCLQAVVVLRAARAHWPPAFNLSTIDKLPGADRARARCDTIAPAARPAVAAPYFAPDKIENRRPW